jgi:hypothetical protein
MAGIAAGYPWDRQRAPFPPWLVPQMKYRGPERGTSPIWVGSEESADVTPGGGRTLPDQCSWPGGRGMMRGLRGAL